VVLHTVPRRWEHKDSGELIRGMISQPKRLEFDSTGLPHLYWYKPIESFLINKEESKGKNGLFSTHLPSTYRNVNIRMRVNGIGKDTKGVELVLNESTLTLQYIEDKYIISSIPLKDSVSFREIKVLIFGEYYEVYCDELFKLSGIAYRHFAGSFESRVGNKAVEHSFRSFSKEHLPTGRDDLNSLW
jgi:hypothetical protein